MLLPVFPHEANTKEKSLATTSLLPLGQPAYRGLEEV